MQLPRPVFTRCIRIPSLGRISSMTTWAFRLPPSECPQSEFGPFPAGDSPSEEGPALVIDAPTPSRPSRSRMRSTGLPARIKWRLAGSLVTGEPCAQVHGNGCFREHDSLTSFVTALAKPGKGRRGRLREGNENGRLNAGGTELPPDKRAAGEDWRIESAYKLCYNALASECDC